MKKNGVLSLLTQALENDEGQDATLFMKKFESETTRLLIETAVEQTSERVLFAPFDIDKLRNLELRSALSRALQSFLDKEKTRVKARQMRVLKQLRENKR